MAVKLDASSKSGQAEDAEVSNCVSNLIHAFSNGLNVFKRLRERRKKRKARKENQIPDKSVSDELQLSKSLRRGPQELAEKYDACYSQTGHSFAKGDAIAHASLAETLIKLNTGLVAIIASFLNHDQKGGKTPLNIDYKSLTNLSDASRKEALQSMTQLYQRISQSQLQLQHFDVPACANCGSRRHTDCSARSSTPLSPSKSKKTHTTPRPRANGPTITRMPLRSSTHPQLVVIRPKPSRKPSSSSSSSSSTKSHSPPTSTYTSPLASPLPLYIAEEPFELHSDGIIKGVLGGALPAPLAGSTRRRKDSFHDSRPSTWPDQVGYQYPFVPQEHLHLPAPKLPSFVPVSPRRSAASPGTSSHNKKPSSSPLPKYPPVSSPARRRIDKVTPSSYTFASDSTKLGEIPQRNWTTPWDYEEAERLNVEAAAVSVPVVSKEEVRDGGAKRKGLFRWMRRGSEGVGA